MGSYESPEESRFAGAADGAAGDDRTGVIRRFPVGRTLVALFVIAVGGAWVVNNLVRGDAKTPNVAPTTTRASTRAFDCSGPKPSDFARISPTYSPLITDITAIDRTTVRLRWVQRNQRVDSFFVSRACPDGRLTNSTYRVSGTVTEYIFRNLDPASAPYCFNVDAWNSDYDLLSETRCISPPG